MQKLKLMKISELEEFIDRWEWKTCGYREGSLPWKFCWWMALRGYKQLHFICWIWLGFDILHNH